MFAVDYIVMLVCLVGMLGVGVFYGRFMKSSKDMFAAGGQSPWWVAGLSGFMTMFSANTFVVWGGIAYQHGAVAMVINLAYGAAAMVVGFFIASRWQRMGLVSVSDYMEARFGRAVVQLVTWFKGIVGVFSLGGGVYALATILCTLIVIPPESAAAWLRDPATGTLAVLPVTLALGVVVIAYTMQGGLWAVLMTDVLQFIILTAAVCLAVPLAFAHVGGVAALAELPDGFLEFTAPEAGYSWLFVLGWVFIHVVVIGGDPPFAQRFTCVPTARDARRSAYLFGALYFISPIIWLLPPLLYRLVDPAADHERAYILMVREVFPAGLVGVMMAAMFSATGSSVSSVLNVYAGVLTRDVYVGLWRPAAGDREQVLAGRVATVLLGLLMLLGAWIIPKYGVTSYIISLSSLAFAPLLLPLIWGLFSPRLTQRGAVFVIVTSLAAGVVYKWFFIPGGAWAELPGAGLLAAWPPLQPLAEVAARNGPFAEILVGNGTPFLLLVLVELSGLWRGSRAAGWERVQSMIGRTAAKPVALPSVWPARIVSAAVGALALLVGTVAVVVAEGRLTLVAFAAILATISATVFLVSRRLGAGGVE